MNRWKMILAVAGVALTCGSVLPLAAQQGGGAGGGAAGDAGAGGRGRGNRGGMFNPNAMKDQLGVSDDEWKVLQPKIDKVNQLRMQQFGFGGRGGRGPGGGDAAASQPASPIAQARADLRAALENKDATAEQIKAKLEAFRKARDLVRADLKKAQDELKEVVTVKQEAVLVNFGTLE